MELWFELGSPYAHLTVQRVEQLATAHGVPITWRPFLLGPIFQQLHGTADSPFNRNPPRGAYMWRDVERRARRHGLTIRKPSQFPRASLLATRIALLGEDEPWIGAFARAVFAASFVDDREIDRPDVIAPILAQLDLDAALIERAGTAETKDRLRARTELAASRGVFGAPTMFAGDEMFWGDDRLEDALIASHGTSPAMTFARAWADAWNAHDLETLLSHYTDDVVLTSPLAARLLGRADGTVRGKVELRAYFTQGLAMAPQLRFDLVDVVPGVDSLAMLFTNQIGTTIVEVVTLDAARQITRVVVHRR